MSLLGATLLVFSTLGAGLLAVQIIRNWADGSALGRAPVIFGVMVALWFVVQLPLPTGVDWRNVPMAFAQVIGAILN